MPRLLYIVGGPPRVGKSVLAQRIMRCHGVPWLNVDILRTVLRTAVPELDQLDRGHSDPELVAGLMYPYLKRAADVALDQSERFLIEGAEWFPRHVGALGDGLGDVTIRACFLGHSSYSADDLAAYEGVNRWHERVSEAERHGLPHWIRGWSQRLRAECLELGQPYVDVGQMGFEGAMAEAQRRLIG